MGALLLLICVGMVSQASSAGSSFPFTVDCRDPTGPTLALRDKNLLITGRDGCHVTENSTIYRLDSTCQSATGVIVVEKVSSSGIVTALKDHVYKVTCRGEEGVVITVDTSLSTVNPPTGNPITESFTIAGNVDRRLVHISLLRYDPSKGGDVANFMSQAAREARLGDRLYLTLYSDAKSGILNVIPLTCEAKMGSYQATLWQLNSSTIHRKECYHEEEVVKTLFSRKTVTGSAHIYVAEIEAFTFRGVHDQELTFSCNVRVCTTETGQCGKDADEVARCRTPAARRRRRRDVEGTDLSQDRVDHVTTKLKIVDGEVTYAESGGATLNLSSILVLLLAVAMVIL